MATTKPNRNNPENVYRREIEETIAYLVGAIDHHRVGITQFVQFARSDRERLVINEFLEARSKVEKGLEILSAIHPNGTGRGEE